MKNINITDRLSGWGKNETRLPANNGALKQKTLESVRPNYTAQAIPARRGGFFFRFLVLATSAACILIIATNPRLFKNPSYYQISTHSYASKSGAMESEELGLSYGADIGLGARNTSLIERVSDMVAPQTAPFDTREFMDTEYYATINTREVQDDSDRALTILRGNGARIDSANQSDKYARIAFAIPKDSLEKMKNELKDLVPEKFYLETAQSQNLLGEKISIEEQQTTANQELQRLEDRRQGVVDGYTKNINEWKTAVDTANRIIASLAREKTSSTNTAKIQSLKLQIDREYAFRQTAQKNLNSFETQYKIDLETADQAIKNQQAVIDGLDSRDTALMQKTEIITGTISLQWIGVWGVLNLYLPMRGILIIAIIIGAWFLLARRRAPAIVLP
ncbi:MAG: hypothetical protein NTW66_00380 [Candidatus Magasanikbacteria bacterium]|nr:hypothetical protein [Candidatus Magasanikbacteria bacterium]